MNKTLYILALLCMATHFSAQELAITESGDSVYLFENGTWSYENIVPEETLAEELSFLTKYKIQDSTYTKHITPIINDKKINKEKEPYALSYNTDVWNRVPLAQLNEAASYTFISKNEEMFGMVIAEKMRISLDQIFNVAMSNIVENIGSDPKIISSDKVIVNGLEMVHVVYQVEVQTLEFTFESLYYSGEEGTYQFTTWTFESLYDANKAHLKDLLFGFTIK